MRAAVDAELDERARVDQQVQPLARRQLALLVLARDLLLAASEQRLRPALVEVLDERAQDRSGRSLGCQGGGAFRQRKVGSPTSYFDGSAPCASSAALSGPSTAARASRRTRSHPRRCPR